MSMCEDTVVLLDAALHGSTLPNQSHMGYPVKLKCVVGLMVGMVCICLISDVADQFVLVRPATRMLTRPVHPSLQQTSSNYHWRFPSGAGKAMPPTLATVSSFPTSSVLAAPQKSRTHLQTFMTLPFTFALAAALLVSLQQVLRWAACKQTPQTQQNLGFTNTTHFQGSPIMAMAATAEDNGGSPGAKAPDNPLRGMIIVTHGTFSIKKAEMAKLLQSHGAIVKEDVDETVTHFLFARRGRMHSEKHKKALQLKITCVSEEWVHHVIAGRLPPTAPPHATPSALPESEPPTPSEVPKPDPTPATSPEKKRPSNLWMTHIPRSPSSHDADKASKSAALTPPSNQPHPASKEGDQSSKNAQHPTATSPSDSKANDTSESSSVRELLKARANASHGKAALRARANDAAKKKGAEGPPHWKAIRPVNRAHSKDAVFPAPPATEAAVKEVEEELDEFDLDEELQHVVGLKDVKTAIRGIATTLKAHQRRLARGLTPPDMSMMCHMLFIGSSGTGKTMVARLVARLLKHIGLLSKGHLVEVAAKDLIAGHCGQTAPKTSAACQKAHGGVLFIDEAYSINPRGDSPFGRECIDTLVKEMEDNRDHFVVMMAGYPESMRVFLETNEGLKSRFNSRFTFYFNDYSNDELAQIYLSELAKRHYLLNPALEPRLVDLIAKYTTEEMRRSQNGRLMRTLVENCISNQNERWVDLPDEEVTDEMMVTILEEDFTQTTSGTVQTTPTQTGYVPGLSPEPLGPSDGYVISGSGTAYYPGFGPIKGPVNGAAISPTSGPGGVTAISSPSDGPSS